MYVGGVVVVCMWWFVWWWRDEQNAARHAGAMQVLVDQLKNATEMTAHGETSEMLEIAAAGIRNLCGNSVDNSEVCVGSVGIISIHTFGLSTGCSKVSNTIIGVFQQAAKECNHPVHLSADCLPFIRKSTRTNLTLLFPLSCALFPPSPSTQYSLY